MVRVARSFRIHILLEPLLRRAAIEVGIWEAIAVRINFVLYAAMSHYLGVDEAYCA